MMNIDNIAFIKELFSKSYFGLTLLEYFFLSLFVFITFSIRGLFSKFMLNKIIFLINKTNIKVDKKIFESLRSPIKLFPIIIILFFISVYLNSETIFINYLIKLNKTIFIIFLFWSIYVFTNSLKNSFIEYELILSKALYQWIFKSFQYFIIFVSFVAAFEIWGINIGPVIAGLGLFGVAIALGAQDLFKNLISGIMIIAEKRFQIGDVISIPNHGSGTVEEIGFRSTIVRKFDSTPMSLPNFIFAEKPILNYSNRFFRRINWSIGLVYNTSSNQLKNITNDIINFIEISNNFKIDEQFKHYVYIEKFSNSSIDILINVFTNTNDWENFLQIQENFYLEIKKIIKNNNSEFAYPTRTLFIEKNDS